MKAIPHMVLLIKKQNGFFPWPPDLPSRGMDRSSSRDYIMTDVLKCDLGYELAFMWHTFVVVCLAKTFQRNSNWTQASAQRDARLWNMYNLRLRNGSLGCKHHNVLLHFSKVESSSRKLGYRSRLLSYDQTPDSWRTFGCQGVFVFSYFTHSDKKAQNIGMAPSRPEPHYANYFNNMAAKHSSRSISERSFKVVLVLRRRQQNCLRFA